MPKRLQTYFAILTVIFATTGALLTGMLVLVNAFGPVPVFWMATSGTLITFSVSLVIGYYIAEPLKDLHGKAQALLRGEPDAEVAPDGRLYEADLLAHDFATLFKKSKSQFGDLYIQQKRQTSPTSCARRSRPSMEAPKPCSTPICRPRCAPGSARPS